MVTVAIEEDGDDDEAFRHVTYAVATDDPAEAVKLSLKDSGAKATMVNCPLEEEQLQRLGLQPGELIALHRDEVDPIIPRPRRH
ncbi:hypothetical protein QA639_33275 [Bradyrhizobium pachyrhizi]|uniref:hypothetical protein n=1 Tax=Bradyrhizobium pachyrhizi TaxID=280333 RepID=UPI0024B27C8B|nr:hypothetical protein [Bradyrhizobium pachyrhizi]WFU54473.1 hypothetical protein QA639_33275 [Bradyrhizobium pachyrhizi]